MLARRELPHFSLFETIRACFSRAQQRPLPSPLWRFLAISR